MWLIVAPQPGRTAGPCASLFANGVKATRELLAEALLTEAISEIHLAVLAEDRDAAGDRLLIDHRGSAVDDDV